MMKKHILVIALLCAGNLSFAAGSYVKGYTRANGTYVQGHTRSAPDSYRSNNHSSRSMGGSRRDEYSSGLGATNKGNSSYGWRDNDRDGVSNRYDRYPESAARGY